MKVKKFQAPTMEEALRMVKQEFGNDAVILSTQKIKNNDSFGLFSREWVEVQAAIDFKDDSLFKLNKKETKNNLNLRGKVNSLEIDDIKNEINELKNFIAQYISKNQHLTQDLPQLKKMISMLMQQSGIYIGDSLNDKFMSLYEDLVLQEVSEEIAHKLIENISFELGDFDNLSLERIRKLLILKMRNKIKIFEEPETNQKPKIIAFIGPTGVGKTTTLAKLAAKYRLIDKKKTALFTLDTYRIAAVEQIKIYGKILKTPVIVINQKNDLKEKLQQFKDYDYILIDTAGRSQKDSFHIKKLKEYLGGDIIIHLLLSATTKSKDLDDIIARYSIIPYSSLLFTKLDESSTFGNIFNKAFETGKPLSYFTTGQRVPEDIEPATKDKLLKLIFEYN